jgi:hypothetical protein
MAATPDETEEFFRALDDLDEALDANVELTAQMRGRIRELRSARGAGLPLRELVSAEDPPLVVQLLTTSAARLQTFGNRVRRTEARALHAEGMTMDEIGRLFGVTRQRVSALLRERPDAAA